MKKILTLFVVFLLAFVIVGCNNDDDDKDVAVETVTVTVAKETIKVGETTTVTATVKPDNATDKDVEFSSSDDAIATVDEDGKVIGVSEGTVTITAEAGGKEGTVSITVEEAEIVVEVEAVELTALVNELKVGETTQLTVEVLPANATNKEVTYASSNDEIATVDENGLVSAVAAGEVTITATAGAKNDTVTLTVVEESEGLNVSNLQETLESVLDTYKNSLNGFVKVTAVSKDGNTTATEFAYNYNETEIDSLMYKQTSNSNAHVYVKDGYVYMLREDLKSKTALTEDEANLIMTQYGFEAVTAQVTSFYSEEELFSSLTLESEVEGVYTFNLDLASYAGSTLNVDGKDSIKIVVTVVEDVVVKVEVQIAFSTGETGSTAIEFKGLEVVAIDFPADLITYPEA